MEKEKICRIREVYRAISALDSEFHQSFGLNLNEAMLLCSLKEHRSASAHEIAEMLSLSHPNTSKVLSSVESRGFVCRKINASDRRGMIFTITKKGEDCLRGIACDTLEVPEILKPLMQTGGKE